MSLGQIYRVACDGGFPRVSGDEPHQDGTGHSLTQFSPREWG